jgi:tetratricopeptide (TPR) repeat protein
VLGIDSEINAATLRKLFSVETLMKDYGDELHEIAVFQKYRGSLAEFIEKSTLPPTFTEGSRFHYRNETVKFHGREKELETVRAFLEAGRKNDGAYSNVHIWCISGAGGVGKSKFARHIAETYYDRYGVVWLNKDNIDKLMNAETDYFPYEKPLLIICDYANMLEEKLTELVNKMVKSHLRAYFLLIERCGQWFKEGFIKKDIAIGLCAYSDEPLELSGKLSVKDYKDILEDFSKHKIYHGKSIDKALVISKTEKLGVNNRCLFLLLTADAYFMNDVPEKWSADELLENYIKRSKNQFKNNHGDSDELCGSAFRMLALATALGGLNVRDKFPSNIKNDKDRIFPDRTTFRLIARQVSETNISGTIMPALEPDIIGEYLFISEFLNLNDSFQSEWLELLAESEPFETVLFRCVRDWRNETKELIEVMAETNAVSTAYIVRKTILSIYDLVMCRKLLKLLDVVYNSDGCDGVAAIYSHAISHISDFADFNERESLLKLLLRIEDSLEDKEGKEAGYVYNNIGSVYDSKGDLDKALEYYEKALDICEKVLSTEHPDTALSYNNIGYVYNSKGDLDNALEYFEKAKDICEKVLGLEHPYTAASYNNIGGVYYSKGEYDKALEYYEKSKDIEEKVLGKEHPYTATSYHNIGTVYFKNEDYETALDYFTKALKIRFEKLGANHPNTQSTWKWIQATRSCLNEDE